MSFLIFPKQRLYLPRQTHRERERESWRQTLKYLSEVLSKHNALCDRGRGGDGEAGRVHSAVFGEGGVPRADGGGAGDEEPRGEERGGILWVYLIYCV